MGQKSQAVKPQKDKKTDKKAAQVAQAPAAAADATEQKTPRIKKNATVNDLNLADSSTATAWLNEFYEQGKAHPPRKGYDQHWNSQGFIHAGPADRLPNKGAAKMVVFLGDVFVKREMSGDKEAGAALDFCINFLQSRRTELEAENNEKILAQAAAIQAKQKQHA